MAIKGQSQVFDYAQKDQYANCKVLLFESAGDIRRHTREMLKQMGFEKILETGDFDSFQSAFGSGKYDLIIGDTSTNRGDVCDFVQRIRHNDIGMDPFPGIILTMTDTLESKIRFAINSGADHLVAKPYSPLQVSERIQAIVDRRKRFLVTLDYVGPDRRARGRNSSSQNLITVPNALRAKVRNDPAAIATPETVRTTIKRIDGLKVLRHDLEIGVLVELLRTEKSSDTDFRRADRLEKLQDLVAMMKTMVPKTEFVEVKPMCLALSSIVTDIRKSDSLTKSELDSLEEASMALHLCFHPEKTISIITQEITDAVAAIARRRRKRK